ncbi:G-type lectin S-receptor-like serine/threonine-protein kinase LECRK2 [Canna indica]|uniref:G-type lectin S-receptor-like serine/threonine-protein kinase LECRK2 n=1 Tax=Canna indica TaxID=4628 RepID=A0AAQ3KLJ4_9LILI|nr:G-type lectin S-receptor-like serine/threonine-protein kinase LECRK2 [Canna indica]
MCSAIFHLLTCYLLHFAIAILQGVAAAQTNNSIPLESSISPSMSPAWFSPSGRFAFGFYPDGGSDRDFYVGVWLLSSPGNITVLWTQNRDNGPLHEDAVMKLTSSGLELQQNDAADSFIPFLLADVSSASIFDSGSFVICDAYHVLWDWESPGPLTDTILSGHDLGSESELVSSFSETNHSSGRFRLKMQLDSNLVMYPVNTSDKRDDAYWSSDTAGKNIARLNLNDHGRLSLYSNISQTPKFNLTSDNLRSGLFYRATLDFDGIFRLYSHDLVSNQTKVLASFPDESTDRCRIKGTCGINSYCYLRHELPVCNCLPGFVNIDVDVNSSGCKQTFSNNACPSADEMKELRSVA